MIWPYIRRPRRDGRNGEMVRHTSTVVSVPSQAVFRPHRGVAGKHRGRLATLATNPVRTCPRRTQTTPIYSARFRPSVRKRTKVARGLRDPTLCQNRGSTPTPGSNRGFRALPGQLLPPVTAGRPGTRILRFSSLPHNPVWSPNGPPNKSSSIGSWRPVETIERWCDS